MPVLQTAVQTGHKAMHELCAPIATAREPNAGAFGEKNAQPSSGENQKLQEQNAESAAFPVSPVLSIAANLTWPWIVMKARKETRQQGGVVIVTTRTVMTKKGTTVTNVKPPTFHEMLGRQSMMVFMCTPR